MNNNKLLTLGTLFFLCLAQLANASNELLDSGFEDPTGNPQNPYMYSGFGYGGDAAAMHWGIYNFDSGSTITQEEPPPVGLSGAGIYSLLISTTASYDGVQQAFGNSNSDTESVSGYVYVVSGSVGIGLVYEGVLTTYASTASAGQWVFLGANIPGTVGIRTFDIFSTSATSQFYVDNVDADTNALTPEPASLSALAFGVLAMLRRRRK